MFDILGPNVHGNARVELTRWLNLRVLGMWGCRARHHRLGEATIVATERRVSVFVTRDGVEASAQIDRGDPAADELADAIERAVGLAIGGAA